MDNFSVVASFVLLGLFLITNPAEGYVRGYRYIDLADQRLQSSPWRRLIEQEIMDAEIKMKEKREDATQYSENGSLKPKHQIYYHYPAPKPTSDGVHPVDGERIPTKIYDEKRTDEFTPKVKYGLDNNRYQNDENDINAQNTASITVILPLL